MDPVLARLGLDLAVDPSRAACVLALAAARVVPLFAIGPLLGGRLVPPVVRVGASLAFVVVLFPALYAGAPPAPPGGAAFVALLVKEVLLGAALGFLASIPLWAAEAGGRLVDTARGATLAESLVPQTGTQTSPLGDLALQLAVVLFFLLDGHLQLMRALAASYEAVPPLGLPAAAGVRGVSDLAVAATGHLVLAALGLAAPVLAALFLADLALGLVSRVAPQLQVFFVGMPAKALAGVLVFLLALGGVAVALRGETGRALGDVARALEHLR